MKWKDYGIEHNSWEPWDNVHAPELLAEFYGRHPGAARHIRFAQFDSIPFRLRVPGRHSLEGEVDVRGHPTGSVPTGFMPISPCLPAVPKYIPPHRRLPAPMPVTSR